MSESKPRVDLAAGLQAGMNLEDRSLEDRFRRADALLVGQTTESPQPPPKDKRCTGQRAKRVTFSMTQEDVDLIDGQLTRVVLETGMRLNQSELVRLGIIGLTKLTPEQLSELCLGLNRLNKRK